jgi:restriction endonuclease S subunit
MALDDLDEDRVNLNFLRYVLEFQGFASVINGAAQPQITRQPLLTYTIPLPPLDEQKRIAGILDQAAALRRLRTRALEKLNTLGQAIFHEMFGGDLRTGAKRPLSSLIDVRSSLDDPKLPQNSTLPHVGPEHIVSGSGTIDWDKVRTCEDDGVISGKYRFEDGDVIFSKIRPYLNKVAIADKVGMCSADMYALHSPSGTLSGGLLHFILGSNDFLAYAETVSNRANIPKMNRAQLLAYETVVPDEPKQIKFQEKLHILAHQYSEALAHAEGCEILFASLQHRAFRGEL